MLRPSPRSIRQVRLASLCLLAATLMPLPVWAQAPLVPPPDLPPLPAEALAPAAANAAQELETLTPKLAVREYLSSETRIRSLFFTQEEIIAIRMAIAAYLKQAGESVEGFDEEDFLSKLAGYKNTQVSSAARYFTYPQFFLESLVYHSPDNWFIWLNGEKITQETAEGKSDIIRVTAIDKDRVSLEWKPVAMNRVMEVWKQSPTDEVTVDTIANSVSFTLRPNQTFSSFVMRVLEGKVKPVQVDTAFVPNSIDAVEASPSPLPAPAAEGVAP